MKAAIVLAFLTVFTAGSNSLTLPIDVGIDIPLVTYALAYESSIITSLNNTIIEALKKRVVFIRGTIGSNDRKVLGFQVDLDSIDGVIQTQNIEFHRFPGTVISAIIAYELKVTPQGASVTTIAGGVGQNFVIVKIQSVNSGPIYYWVEIWGP